MKHRKLNVALELTVVLNVLLMATMFSLAWAQFYYTKAAVSVRGVDTCILLCLGIFLSAMFCRTYDAFKVPVSRVTELLSGQALSLVITDVLVYLIMVLLMHRFPNPLPLIAVLIAQTILAGLWSAIVKKWYFKRCPAEKTAVIYEEIPGLEELVEVYDLTSKFDVQRVVTVDEYRHNPNVLDGMETVFISGVHSHDRNTILKDCIADGMDAYVLPRIGDTLMRGAKPAHLFHLPILQVESYHPSVFYLAAKRIFDIVVSGLALVVLSPLFLVVSIAIKRVDGGPVFYKQKRLTKGGKVFEIHKFRSMRVDAEKDGVARLSTGVNDDRITPVGRVIRKYRIDELPQLIDILKGHLSVVGPRPERPEIAEQYCRDIPEFELRLQAKAGLTGYAQVYGKYNSTPYEKLQMDLMYISKPSFFEDLRLCFATVKILFEAESTEGIAEGKTTAMTNEYAGKNA